MTMKRTAFATVLAATITTGTSTAHAHASARVDDGNGTQIQCQTKEVKGIKIFYREAGDPNLPTILLLHGFDSSSHMFRDLMPLLSRRFHLVAPDYPGFGYSDAPATDTFDPT